MAKKRRTSREQLKIAGTERPDRVPELDALADEYRDMHEQEKAFKEIREACAEELIAVLQQRGLARYVYEDKYGQLQEVTIADLTVKVQIRKLVTPRLGGGGDPN